MLGTFVLLLVLAASAVVACILFVLFGPVPVNRKVVIVSPIQAMPTAASAIMMEPVRAAPVIWDTPADAPTPTEVAVAAAITPAPIAPPKPAPRPRKITPVERGAAPLAARAPRGTTPPPLPRSRAARGTHGRPHQVFDSVEVTARQSSSFDADEHTHLDEAQLS